MSGSGAISGGSTRASNKDLDVAYGQLLQYREALENPPLLVVCDFDRIVIHTNFTNAPSEVHELHLPDLNDGPRPGTSASRLPRSGQTASRHHEPGHHVGGRAAISPNSPSGLGERGEEPHAVARFLDRLVFCMFAEDIDLLPNGLFIAHPRQEQA